MRRQLTAFALATAAALGAAALGAAALAAADEPQEKRIQRIVVHGAAGAHAGALALPDPAQIPGDHLRVDDLASYAPGESRSYTTTSGAQVTITRAADGGERYTLSANGKEVEIGGTFSELAFIAGHGPIGKRILVRHEEKRSADGNEEVEEERTIDGPVVDLLVAGDGPPPLVVEIVGEQNGKATRQVLVLRTVEKRETD